MTTRRGAPDIWRDEHQVRLVAWNVASRYAAIGFDALIGLAMLPFNIGHLGNVAYGLWVLAASVSGYFTALDLGYGQALVKFVAQYRSLRDARAMNQIISTLFFVFAGIGLLAYAAMWVVAMHLPSIFTLTPEQARVGRLVLLIVGANVAVGFPFTVFGAVINGFQRYYVNSVVSIASTVAVALVNVIVLSLGYGLVELVAATTLVRILTFGVYRMNAYRVFPALKIRFSAFRRERLREVTGFSVYMLVLDWANRLNYTADTLVIGVFVGAAAIATWTVAQRLAEVAQRLTNQLNDALFPVVVESDAGGQEERLRLIFLQGTRVTLVTVILIAGSFALYAKPLVNAWVGHSFSGSIILVQLLVAVVILRVGDATATTVLKGAGRHRLLAGVNSATAIANVVISIALVRPLGLMGVALGTLIPVGAAAVFVLFPLACHRVGIGVGRAFREAVWPALWPGLVVLGWVQFVGPGGGTLLAIGVEGLVTSLAYLLLFAGVAIGRSDRRLYWTKGLQLVRTGRSLETA